MSNSDRGEKQSDGAAAFSVSRNTAKLTTIIVSTSLVSLLVAAAALVVYDRLAVRKELVSNRALLAELIGSNSTGALSFDDSQFGAEVLSSLEFDPHIVSAALYTPEGNLFAKYVRTEDVALPTPLPEGTNHQFGTNDLDVSYVVVEDDLTLGTVCIKSSLDPLYARTSNYLGIVGVVIVGSLLVGYLVSRGLQPMVSRPIEELAKRDAELVETNVQLAESERAAQAANLAKSVFLANMSHELRTPITVITGYSEMLLEEAEDQGQEDFVPDLKKILASGEHLLSIINDILDLSKIEAGRIELFLEVFSVDEMVEAVVTTIDPLIRKNDNTLVVDCPNSLGSIQGDVTRLRQCLFNLLSNAAKFTDQGTITLHAARDPNRDWLTFRIQDTGIGLTPQQMAKLFQSFSQADASTSKKYGGTGLGLAITKRLCRLMGGDLSVESTYGEGTTFTIQIPAGTGEPQPVPAKVAGAAAPSGNGEPLPDISTDGDSVVLVIDDDPEIRGLFTRFLDNQGFQVVTASNGNEGIQLARRYRPLAITLDVLMPGMDGWAVLKALKDSPDLAEIPVIIISIVEDKNLGYALGVSDYLTKPTDRHRLVEILDRFRTQKHSRRVLVVEDDPDARALLRKTLEKEQWQVFEAENGQVALAQVVENRPDLILLDLAMPVMDGFQFVRKLRDDTAEASIPIIVITGKELTDQEQERLGRDVPTILEKGAYTREELLHEVGNLVKAYSNEQAPKPTS